MAELRTYRCDVCPAVMKEGETGWYRAFSDTESSIFIVAGWGNDLGAVGYRTGSGTSVTFIDPRQQKHVCSESCASKLMSRAIGAGTSSPIEEDAIPEYGRAER